MNARLRVLASSADALARRGESLPIVAIDVLDSIGTLRMIQQIQGLLSVLDVMAVTGLPTRVDVMGIECFKEAIDASTAHPILHIHVVHRQDIAKLLRRAL